MNLTTICIPLGVLAMVWNITTTILIFKALRERNIEASFLFLKFFAPKYAKQYKEITQKETGSVGPLFYHWIISINAALVAAILIILARLI
ncbi:MAG: hypothetical protein ABIL68_17375 [bacterium]